MDIDQLIIVAGPTCVGKSTLMDAMRAGEERAVAGRLGLDDVTEWKFLSARKLYKRGEISGDKVVLHYDMTRRFSFAEDQVIDLIGQVQNISVLTLWSAPATCLARVKERKRRIEANLHRRAFRPIHMLTALRRLGRLARLCDLFETAPLLIQRYQEWFDHLAYFPLDQHWLCAPREAGERLSALEDWPRVAGLLLRDHGHPLA